jgi:hypothetical protein
VATEQAPVVTNDSEQEAGMARDAQGRVCDFGPHNDECPNASNTLPKGSKAEDGSDISGWAKLPPGQHYVTCEERGQDNHLACDIVNDTRTTTGGLYDLKLADNPGADFQSGLKHGKADEKASCNHPEGCHWWIRMRGNGFMNQTQEFVRGYILGFCSNTEFGSIGSGVAQASFDCDKGPAAAGYKPMNSSDFWTPDTSGRNR